MLTFWAKAADREAVEDRCQRRAPVSARRPAAIRFLSMSLPRTRRRPGIETGRGDDPRRVQRAGNVDAVPCSPTRCSSTRAEVRPVGRPARARWDGVADLAVPKEMGG